MAHLLFLGHSARLAYMLAHPKKEITKNNLLKRMEHLRELFKLYNQRECEDGEQLATKKREQKTDYLIKTQFEEVQARKHPAVSVSRKKSVLRWKKSKTLSSKEKPTEKKLEKKLNVSSNLFNDIGLSSVKRNDGNADFTFNKLKNDDHELSYLPLTKILHHRDFRNACKMMSEIKKRKMIDRLLDANDSGMIRKMFESDIAEPTKEVKLLHRALNILWEELMCNIAEFKFEREVVVKARFLDVMLLYPHFVPDTWGGRHLCHLVKSVGTTKSISHDEGDGLIPHPVVEVVEWNVMAKSGKTVNPVVNEGDQDALVAIDGEEEEHVAELGKCRPTKKKRKSRPENRTRKTALMERRDQQNDCKNKVEQFAEKVETVQEVGTEVVGKPKVTDDFQHQAQEIIEKQGNNVFTEASSKLPEVKAAKSKKNERNVTAALEKTRSTISQQEIIESLSDGKLGDSKKQPKIENESIDTKCPEINEMRTQEEDADETTEEKTRIVLVENKHIEKDENPKETRKNLERGKKEETKEDLRFTTSKEKEEKKQMTGKKVEKEKGKEVSRATEKLESKIPAEQKEREKVAEKGQEEKDSEEKIGGTRGKLTSKTFIQSQEKINTTKKKAVKEEGEKHVKMRTHSASPVKDKEHKGGSKDTKINKESKKKSATKETSFEIGSIPKEQKIKAKNSDSEKEHRKKKDPKVKKREQKEHKPYKSAESEGKESGYKKSTLKNASGSNYK
uniref:Bromo domain-containing protein n=1 Tax=Angiostrongylus cantonensis TaxID=6313 RepID=A0A0K0DNB8_ANGCA